MSGSRTLIVSAFEPEIAPLRAVTRGTRSVTLQAVGIGAIEAAVGAARAIAAVHPTRVIFVGTAGLYGGVRAARAALGKAEVAGEIVCVSTATLRAEAYLPALTVLRAETSPRLRAALLAEAGTTGGRAVACPLAITRTEGLARRIARATGASLENLEAFGVARAAAMARVELGVVLGVANRVGPTGHDEWRRHHRDASRAACAVVAQHLGLRPLV